MKFALRGLDRDVVDAGMALAHQSGVVERPILVAVRPKPSAACVMPFIGEADGDARIGKGPDLFDQPVVLLLRPFAGKKFNNRRLALKKFAAVAQRLSVV
jgi:hypothetical protein